MLRGSKLLLPSIVKPIRPPLTISFARQFRKMRKSLWNCSRYAFITLVGLVVDIHMFLLFVLWNSGTCSKKIHYYNYLLKFNPIVHISMWMCVYFVDLDISKVLPMCNNFFREWICWPWTSFIYQSVKYVYPIFLLQVWLLCENNATPTLKYCPNFKNVK